MLLLVVVQELDAANAAAARAHTHSEDMRSNLGRVMASQKQLADKKHEIVTLKAR